MSSFPLSETAENLWCETCLIKSGANVADAITTQGHAVVGIMMPAAWTAANLGYEVSLDNVTYYTCYDAGGNFQKTVVEASAFIAIPLSQSIFSPYLRIKSVDDSNVAVTQGADRTVLLVLRRFLGGS
jgi:hypothetical protein